MSDVSGRCQMFYLSSSRPGCWSRGARGDRMRGMSNTTTVGRTAGPLDGIRVLDLSQVVSGPICGRMLADLGADVVKLEPPEGDIIRWLQPQVGDAPVSVYFTWVNAGKRSVSLDLRTDRGAELAQQLAGSSDVIVENFRPGVLAKFGLDADTLRAR